mmetsp:Transcript_1109/g.3528  ORF Transcript_1109/g.3528 Transcript_1109/m.3528 type:complete len:254 (+) Transcript_1109:567-1328(+)
MASTRRRSSAPPSAPVVPSRKPAARSSKIADDAAFCCAALNGVKRTPAPTLPSTPTTTASWPAASFKSATTAASSLDSVCARLPPACATTNCTPSAPPALCALPSAPTSTAAAVRPSVEAAPSPSPPSRSAEVNADALSAADSGPNAASLPRSADSIERASAAVAALATSDGAPRRCTPCSAYRQCASAVSDCPLDASKSPSWLCRQMPVLCRAQVGAPAASAERAASPSLRRHSPNGARRLSKPNRAVRSVL